MAAHAAVTRRCGPVIGKRQVEQAVMSAAGDIAAFYTARVPVPCTASALLVISADAKGFQHAINSADKGRSPARMRSGRGSLVDTAGQNLPAAMSARLTRVTT